MKHKLDYSRKFKIGNCIPGFVSIKKPAKVQLFLVVFIFYLSPIQAGRIIYVDQLPAEQGSSWDGTDGHSYVGIVGNGIGYSDLHTALQNMQSGDDLYLRGDTYTRTGDGDETFHIIVSGTSDDWSSIQSYPGEWAHLVGGGDFAVIGHRAYHDQCPASGCRYYWKFERIEISGGNNAGIWSSGGPIIVRYCYIHDNYASTGGDNPGGLYFNVPFHCIIEYNIFDANGATNTAGTNCAQIQFLSDYAISHGLISYDEVLSDGLYNPNSLTTNNQVRYNLFKETTDRSTRAFKHKAGQTIVPHDLDSTLPVERKNMGDKIHHNIIFGDQQIEVNQDLVQVYNNIIPESDISVGYYKEFIPLYTTIYNNYVKHIYYPLPYSPSSKYYLWRPEDDVLFRKDWTFNNIIDNSRDSDMRRQICFERYMCNIGDKSGCSPTYDDATVLNLDDFYFQNNYIYRPDNDNDVWNADLKAPGHKEIGLLSNWEAQYSNIYNNYRKTSSEGTDNLMAGSSGVQALITRGAHSLGDGSHTIANGGCCGAHPYLEGVNIPCYIGAVDPNDDSWVEDVINLGVIVDGVPVNLRDSYSGKQTYTLTVNPLTGDGFSIYPNPAAGKLIIAGTEGVTGIEVYSLSGRKVYQAKDNITLPYSVDVSLYQPGIYVVKVIKGEKCFMKRVVKE